MKFTSLCASKHFKARLVDKHNKITKLYSERVPCTGNLEKENTYINKRITQENIPL
jgi:hypothetical protein